MTHEELVKKLKDEAAESDLFDEKEEEWFSMIIDALEKQIPKKPTMTRGKYGHTECACCGWVVESFCGDLEQYPFCPNCGQAIDWEVSK